MSDKKLIEVADKLLESNKELITDCKDYLSKLTKAYDKISRLEQVNNSSGAEWLTRVLMANDICQSKGEVRRLLKGRGLTLKIGARKEITLTPKHMGLSND